MEVSVNITTNIPSHSRQLPFFPRLQQLSLSESSGAGGHNLSSKEFSRIIQEKKASIDSEYMHSIAAGLNCELKIWSVAGSPNTQSIELQLPMGFSEGLDVVEVMSSWMSVLSQEGGAVELHSQASDDKKRKIMSFVAVPPGNGKPGEELW
jgi:hypothetical protein